MGNILSDQESTSNHDEHNTNDLQQSWKVLEKNDFSEILISKKTTLVVQRYSFQVQTQGRFESENKLYQWRNNNPNSELMVNVLSFNKDQYFQSSFSFQCSSIRLCPSQNLTQKIYVVTQRILKVGQINSLLLLQEDQNYFAQNKNSIEAQLNNFNDSENISSSSALSNHRQRQQKRQKKRFLKFLPFIKLSLSQKQAKLILSDWFKGIQVLCYKFGYFTITQDHLGINSRRRGNVWISKNYSLNRLPPNFTVEITTAQQKFKFQRQIIEKVVCLTQNIQWFKNIVSQFKNKKIERFNDVLVYLTKSNTTERGNQPTLRQKLSAQRKVSKKEKKSQQQHENKKQNSNSSLFVEHYSFMNPLDNRNNCSLNNQSLFQFDSRNICRRVTSQERRQIVPVNGNNILPPQLSSNYRNYNKGNALIKSGNNPNFQNADKQLKRSSTGEKISHKLSPESKQQIYFVNSNHKYCGKETAPTNQLGHSSTLQSVINQNRGVQDVKVMQNNSLYKTHNQKQFHLQRNNPQMFQKPSSSPSNKIYFHSDNRHPMASENHLFRSQNYSFNSDIGSPHYKKIKQDVQPYHNFSLDEHNIVGPYKKDKFYSNLKREKIALVDSMVMVKQQDIEQDLHNMSGTKIVLQQSIILMGRQSSSLSSPREFQLKNT